VHAELSELLTVGAKAKKRWATVLSNFRHCRSVTATIGTTHRPTLSMVSLTTIGTCSAGLELTAREGSTTLVVTFVVFEAKQFVGVIAFSTVGVPAPQTVDGRAKLAQAKAATGATIAQSAPSASDGPPN